jgi:hypothetical protein
MQMDDARWSNLVVARQCAAAALSDAERGFLADLVAAEDPGAFIEDSFLQTAVEGGQKA